MSSSFPVEKNSWDLPPYGVCDAKFYGKKGDPGNIILVDEKVATRRFISLITKKVIVAAYSGLFSEDCYVMYLVRRWVRM